VPQVVRPPMHVPTVAGGNQVVQINSPGQPPINVPMQALQALKPGEGIPTGMNNHLLVKTENGQYQILRVEPSAANAVVSGAPPAIMTAPNSLVRPALPTRPVGPPPPTVAASMAAPQAPRSTVTTAASAGAQAPRLQAGAPPSRPAPAAAGGGAGSSGGMGGQMTPDTAKLKCKNFLATLLRLAGEQPAAVATNVRNLIQGLIDGKVEPELFTTKLQKELSSSPQPCLVPFLKKSLPYLQQSLASGELTIEGVRAPPPTMVPNLPQQPQPPGSAHPGARPALLQPQIVRTGVNTSRPGSAANVIYSNAVQQPRPGVVRTPMAAARMTGTTATKITGSPGMPHQPKIVRTQMGTMANRAMVPNSVGPGGTAMTMQKLTGQGMMLKPGMPASTTPGTSVTPLGKQAAFTSPSPFGAAGTTIKKTTISSVPSSPASTTTSATAKSSSQPSAYSGNDGDDDINDVAAMGGVNLAEEATRMATDTILTSTALRSCGKDETFLQTGRLHERVARLCRERGLDEPPPEVINLVSHATQERLKTLLEKLSVIAEHRLDVVAAAETGDRYDVTQNVRGQIKFLNELERIERKRHDEAEREALFRAAKSRTKTEDPEKERMRIKAKEMRAFEDEQQRQEQANNTAMLAIGGAPRKKLRMDEPGAGGGGGLSVGGSVGGLGGLSGAGTSGLTSSATLANRPRLKRVHIRDLHFLMEQEKQTKRSHLLWKALCS